MLPANRVGNRQVFRRGGDARRPDSPGPASSCSRLFEGDTVQLAYGGPLMTVLALKPDRCCCIWFDEHDRLVHGEFEREVVRFVESGVRLIPHAESFWRSVASLFRPARKPASVRARPVLSPAQ